jgi:hypothetical protein
VGAGALLLGCSLDEQVQILQAGRGNGWQLMQEKMAIVGQTHCVAIHAGSKSVKLKFDVGARGSFCFKQAFPCLQGR